MIIDLASVGTTAKPVEGRFSAAAIDLEDVGNLIGEAAISGAIRREGNKVHLGGEIVADVEAACSRCLEPVAKHLSIAFEDIFVDAIHESHVEETELRIEEMDESLVTDGHVDLAGVIREQIILEMPETILCQEDCKGLCPQCGQNLNLIDCNCESDDMDPRWAALKNLN